MIHGRRSEKGRLLNTLDETTKGLPIVGGVTSPLLKTVGGVTDGLPIVCLLNPHPSFQMSHDIDPSSHQVGSGGQARQQTVQTQQYTTQQYQAPAPAPKRVLTEAEKKQKALEKKKRLIALKKQQLELEAAELEMED